MVKLNFNINDQFLASYIISRYREERYIPYAIEKYKKDIVAFQDLAWVKSKELSKLIDGRNEIYMQTAHQNQSFSELGHEIDCYLAELSKSDEFKLLKKQTSESQKEIEQEQTTNYEETFAYMQNLGIDINTTCEIMLVHPGLKAGRSLGLNRIVQSHQTYWPHYNTVYIWHEILHSYFKPSDATHALIELITDEKLRIQLNGGEYPPFVGHAFLAEIKLKGLPIWQAYLDKKSKMIAYLISDFEKIIRFDTPPQTT